MSKLQYAKSHRDLLVYQRARELARELFIVSQGFPREEKYALTDQLRRSSRSVGAQIAEAWAKRRYERSFTSKLVDADGEQYETQHWIEMAADCGYLDADQMTHYLQRCEEIGRLLGSMLAKADQFCGTDYSMLRESEVAYHTSADNLSVEP